MEHFTNGITLNAGLSQEDSVIDSNFIHNTRMVILILIGVVVTFFVTIVGCGCCMACGF